MTNHSNEKFVHSVFKYINFFPNKEVVPFFKFINVTDTFTQADNFSRQMIVNFFLFLIAHYVLS